MRIRIFILTILAACSSAFGFNADSLRVSFVNFYPGSQIWALEGHSALRLQYPGDSLFNRFDLAVNYGIFDFNQSDFVYRFVKGETDYRVEAYDWNWCAEDYVNAGRRIVEHPLEMDSLQKARLWDLLLINLQPENKTYRYNYVKDNCATRPLRIVERAMGDSIILPSPRCDAPGCANCGAEENATVSFRDVMRHYHRNYPWYQFGIDLALGSGIDYPIDDREKAFAPVLLDAQLQYATVGGRKLTSDPVVLFPGEDATDGPTPWYATPMFVFCLLLAIVTAITWRDIRRCKVTRWIDALLFFVFGLAGLLLTFLIFVSSHEATSPNWLYLWLNPLCLIVPALIWIKRCQKVVLYYQYLNTALILAMAIAWPFTGQSANWAFAPLIACDVMRSLSYIYVYQKNKSKTN